MIESFAHNGLKRYYKDDDGRKRPLDLLERIGIVLAALDEAQVIEDMNRPSFRLHKLTGKLKDYWAVTVRANWRIVFQFKDGNAHGVNFIDYH